jgi:hypothetical protein
MRTSGPEPLPVGALVAAAHTPQQAGESQQEATVEVDPCDKGPEGDREEKNSTKF